MTIFLRAGPESTAMARYHRSAGEVPDGLQIPHWSWDGLVGPNSGDR